LILGMLLVVFVSFLVGECVCVLPYILRARCYLKAHGCMT
jgi:hypothetical protein